MKRTTLLAASALVWAATAVLASVPGEGPPPAAEGTTYLGGAEMTYELFERTIEHVDLESCPPEFDPEAVFCRMTLAAEQAHVFAFSYLGDQPLLVVKSYPLTADFVNF